MGNRLDIVYDYTPVPTCAEFARSNVFLRSLMGCFGSGKSSACCVEIVRRGREQKPGPDGMRRSRWAVIRNTMPELKETTMKTFFQWFPEQYFGRHYVADHRFVIKAFAFTEIEVVFLALDRPEDIKKLLSLELTGAWVNEAREVPWSVIEALQGRVGRYPAQRDGGPTWFGVFMDTNPPDIESKFHKFFENPKLDQTHARIFKQPSGLAPNAENLVNLPGGRKYYETLAKGKTDEWVKVYVHGDYGFVMDGKLVFPEYNDRVHCQEVDPIPGTVIRGWDFGLTPACIFTQILPDGRWLWFDEMVSDNMGIARFGGEVLDHCRRSFPRDTKFIDYGDPAGEQRAQTDERTVFEVLHNLGIPIEGGEQSLTIRLESMRQPLRTLLDGEPQFIIHPRCKTARKGFQGGYHYRRMQVTSERYTTQPNKNQFSHVMDAGQYVATRIFGGALVGDDDVDEDFPVNHYSPISNNPVTGY